MAPRRIFEWSETREEWISYWREDADHSETGYDTPVSEHDFEDLENAEWEVEEPF